MYSRYARFISKHNIYILPFLIIFFVYLTPVGLSAFEAIPTDIPLQEVSDAEDVFSFTSLTDDLVFIIQGDENLLSQPVWDWVARMAFDLQNHPVIQKYGKDGAPIQHIFKEVKQFLTPYYVNLYSIIAIANVTTFIVINGTQDFLDFWTQEVAQNSSITVENAAKNFIPVLRSKVDKLAFGRLYLNVATAWINLLARFLDGQSPQDITYSQLVNEWQDDPANFVPDVDFQIQEIFLDILPLIDEQFKWIEADLYRMLASYLFNRDDMEAIAFLDDVFQGGVDPLRSVKISNEVLMPYLRLEYTPIGLPEAIREFYLTAFTSSNGKTLATSMIMRVSLRKNLTENEYNKIFEEMEAFAIAENENEFNYRIAFMSLLNYKRERDVYIKDEVSRIDTISISIALIIVLLFIGDPILTILATGIAWLTAQVAKGLLISDLLGLDINSTAFSMAANVLLGAAMNYSVFFTFRFKEFYAKSNDVDLAIEGASKTALHSVGISGLAVMVAMIPYFNSSLVLMGNFSFITFIGILIEIGVLFIALPSIFSLLKFFPLSVPQPEKRSKLRFTLRKSHAKKVLLISLILVFISLLVIYYLNPTFAVNDLIGEEGQTGLAKEILDEDFPDNYLSKILVSLQYNKPILNGTHYNLDIINEISALTGELASIPSIQTIVSPAWPLGTPFDFSDQSIALIEAETSKIISKTLLSEDASIAYIIVQLSTRLDDKGTLRATGQIIHTVDNFDNPLIVSKKVSGIPVQSYNFNQTMLEELPLQLLMSVVLIILFLWWQLKSLQVPIRLELTIIISSIYAISITSILLRVLGDQTLNLINIVASLIVLLGLGTDFDIYIYRRIMEEKSHNITLENAIHRALANSGPAIQTSGLVMSFTFLSLMASNINALRQFGLLTSIAILLDIFLIRLILVPSILLISEHRVTSNHTLNNDGS